MPCLISIQGEEAVQQKLEDCYINWAIYEDILKEMEENGYNQSQQQCQHKLKHPKNALRKAQDATNRVGTGQAVPFTRN